MLWDRVSPCRTEWLHLLNNVGLAATVDLHRVQPTSAIYTQNRSLRSTLRPLQSSFFHNLYVLGFHDGFYDGVEDVCVRQQGGGGRDLSKSGLQAIVRVEQTYPLQDVRGYHGSGEQAIPRSGQHTFSG